MSEMMLGVLNMPDDLFWSNETITRMQHNSIRKEAARRITELEATIAEIKEAIEKHKASYSHWNDCDIDDAEKELWALLEQEKGDE